MNARPDRRPEEPGTTSPAAAVAPRPDETDAGRATRQVPWLVESLIVFIVGVALMRSIYAGTDGVPGHDSFYHIKMAMLLPEHGFLNELPWLRFTYFTDEGHAFVEHHPGFHLLLVPFVTVSDWMIGDPLAGARWAMMLFFGAALVLFNLLLITGGVRWRWVWLVLFVLMPLQFFTRHAYVRAINPSLVFMLLIMLGMLTRRFVLTALAVAGYVHLYMGGVLYAPALVSLHVAGCLIGPREEREVPWRLIGWTAAGWILGVVTHPYSGGMYQFLKLQIFGSGLTPDISVGREWEPYEDVWWFAQMSGVVLTVWAIAVCVRLRSGPRIDRIDLTLLLAHFLFFTLTLKARRFVEYWPIFCLLSAAFLAAPSINAWAQRCDAFLDAGRAGRANRFRVGGAVVLLLVTGVIVYATPPWHHIRESAQCGYDLPAVRKVMTFLKDNSDPGDVVFTDDWDIFPVFFYYNSHNHYIVGLDPKFTQFRRPRLWERYVRITRGQTPAYLGVKVRDKAGEEQTEKIHIKLDDIRGHFGARFVITDRDHKPFAAKLVGRPDLAELLYPSDSYEDARDGPYLIFRIHRAE